MAPAATTWTNAVVITLGILANILGVYSFITVYHPADQQQYFGTSTAAAADYTGAAAYNPTVLIPPAPPNPPIPTEFGIELRNGGGQGSSIPQSGSFFGFSIEMSVVDQILGKNSTVLQVPFLNLMANLIRSSGRVTIRVGGNTQETAALVDSTPNGHMLAKDINGASNPTLTPPLDYTADLIYLLGNVSSLVNVDWFLGIPFHDTSTFHLAIAEVGQRVLGPKLIGLQVGNEPDLYGRHGHRPETYSPFDYFGEFGDLVNAMSGDAHVLNQHLLIGPNIATGDWTPEMVWNTGFVDTYLNNLAYLAVEHYPISNCFAQFGVGSLKEPQQVFANFLTHNSGMGLVAPYLGSTMYAQSKGKKMLMFETNTASCGGFPGISDSFGAALWGLDYAMQMAHSNFSGALFHIGGQNVYYNPFTPPPTNQSTFRQWTVGPIYYSALVMAEALGPSNIAEVMDLRPNNENEFTPAYAIYEAGRPVRVLLFNYVTDPSGASDITVFISVGGGQTGEPGSTPTHVKVKRLSASSVSQKGNISWAGQTFGENFGSDGRPTGEETIETVPCNQGINICAVKVPAPGAALVFLSETARVEVDPKGATKTFPTTFMTRTANTVTVDPSVLATSNGHSGFDAEKGHLGSTSKGSISGSADAVRGSLDVEVWRALLVSGVVMGFVLVGL